MKRDALLSPGNDAGISAKPTDGRRAWIFLVIFLDAQHRVLQHNRLFSARLTVEGAPREIVPGKRLKLNASAVVIPGA